ncbi:HlyD family efflux transporter periplasmic adaptor subunit [Pseudoalteromonas sp. JC3]|uniref:HlyD family secretion protein n=1 Tax=Pseudoalteromonas sp. JC3 TaxID=2810196 RepID=UPI0019CF9400|nr:HlyD family efflux transporter periplasmic adaptor subunit [Pseudoalteromonas sp. JC3]MBR8842596.1 HlyD family efflux transporter periplasmic adaptor subunit [Pseudoalteromonas sp. JC3]WJE10071.1 HlyD family efflux transporter periplasmic adaptor subunit [Pseudoalteromonas sp. JC3]
MSLFRKEAIESQHQKLHGDVFLTQPISFSWVTALLSSIFVVFIFFLFSTSYSRTENVSGHIVPSNGLIKIKATYSGILKDIIVDEGQSVQSGETIAIVSRHNNMLEGGKLAEQLVNELDQKRKLIELQKRIDENQETSEYKRLSAQQVEYENKISSLEKQISIQKQIESSEKIQLENMKLLFSTNSISQVDFESKHQSYLAKKQHINLLEERLIEIESYLEQTKLRKLELPDLYKSKILNLNIQLADINSQRAELDSSSAYVLTSPVSGKVAAINVKNGISVQSQLSIATIIPKNSKLEVELFVPSKAIGFVEKGQTVRIFYDAFPFQKFGSYTAKIISVTETILTPDDLSSQFNVHEPVYKARAELDHEYIKVGDRQFDLDVGMSLRANIVLERNSLIDWILSPLKALSNRA